MKPIPNGYLLREGDVVFAKATVRFDQDAGDERIHLRVEGYRDISIPLSDLVGIGEFKFAVGDQVRTAAGLGMILALGNDWAWVSLAVSVEPRTYRVIDLVPVPSQETPK